VSYYEETEKQRRIKERLKQGWRYVFRGDKLILVPPKTEEQKRKERMEKPPNPSPKVDTSKIEDTLDEIQLDIHSIAKKQKDIFELLKIDRIYKTPELRRKYMREYMRKKKKIPKKRWRKK
jgi:hypothetical protein